VYVSIRPQSGHSTTVSTATCATDIAEVAERWRTWTAHARPELTTSLVIGHSHVAVHGCWVGARDAGRALVDAWRTWRTPHADDWSDRAAGDLDAVNPGWLAPTSRATQAMTCEWATALRDELTDELIRLVAERLVGVVEVRLVGGAARMRSGDAANGYARRDQYLVTLADLRVPHAEARAPLAPWVTGAAYLDRTDPTERAARADDAVAPAQRARLAAVKAALDPSTRFRPCAPGG